MRGAFRTFRDVPARQLVLQTGPGIHRRLRPSTTQPNRPDKGPASSRASRPPAPFPPAVPGPAVGPKRLLRTKYSEAPQRLVTPFDFCGMCGGIAARDRPRAAIFYIVLNVLRVRHSGLWLTSDGDRPLPRATNFRQPPSVSRRGFLRPRFATARPRTLRARGTPGSRWTHGPRRLAAPGRNTNSASPPLVRRPARGVYRLAPQDPRWSYTFRRGPICGSPCLTTAVVSRRRTSRFWPAKAPPPGESNDARSARRDPAAWAAIRFGCASWHPCEPPPPPAPRLVTLAKRPSVGRDAATIAL